MKILITGICGFVGSTLAIGLREHADVFGIDNFIRPGSETNRMRLREHGIQVQHSDIRNASDVSAWPRADWVIDAAALPSVLAGVDGHSSSRQLLEHNLGGTINILEYCREQPAGLILLSTSRVYSIAPLAGLRFRRESNAFSLDLNQPLPVGISDQGVSEKFSTTPPVSLYGSSKLASEQLALEYGASFQFPVWINRCGVLAGSGQFGQAEQGIFSFWIHSWKQKHPLRYIGFDGSGAQLRDALHPRDIVSLIRKQIDAPHNSQPRIVNVSGGINNSMSLSQLSAWCESRFGPHQVAVDMSARPFDLPWMILDHTLAFQTWGWKPETTLIQILEEIASHAESDPQWLRLSKP